MKAGFFQESDGSWSSRRLFAACYATGSLVLYYLSATRESKWAFWAGVACTVAAIILPILTTFQEIKDLVAAAKDVKDLKGDA